MVPFSKIIMEEYAYQVLGYVRVVKPNGYGFICPNVKIHEEDKKTDIYFHASHILNEDFKWKDIVTGMKVEIACVVKTATGYSAMGVTFLKPKQSKKR